MSKIKIILSICAVFVLGVNAVSAQSTGVVLYGSPTNYGYNTGYTNYNYGYNNYDPYNSYYNNGYNGYYGNYNYSPISVSAVNYNPYDYYQYSTPYYNYNNNYNYNNYNYSPTFSVYTTPVSNVGPTNATINGNLTVSGNSNNYNYNSTANQAWFEYGLTSTNLNVSTGKTNIYSSTTINSNLTGLICNTTYYYRAVVSGTNGNQYGSTLSFTTLPCQNNYYNNSYYPYNNYYQYPYNNNYNYNNYNSSVVPTNCGTVQYPIYY